ncbi:FadR/GntR family transcriptional regulator [Gordonia soli]|uniref:Putative GntR family transcriptional regulator n=1 Tax=Gordonia soli NBRC 108243 TaxID=1223545 RepID=M0QGS2_9ACTN|nr:FCD domain-containing protein [Gordonia soli]GAC67758.1 putative GntR family transcriptional regulator [Gordonia soli NBRC 108243]
MTHSISPPPRTSELVVDRMRSLIADGTWAVGGRIPAEPELVAEFGVGRNTIREAVRALEHAGMLVPRRGDGTYVRSRSALAGMIERCAPPTEARQLFEVRRALEGEAAAAAAERASADVVDGLRELLVAAERAIEADDLDGYGRADIAFHAGLVAASDNPLLIELYGGISEVIARGHPAVLALSLDRREHPRGHRDVVEAIAAHDPHRARAAVQDYLDDAEQVAR